MTNIGHLYFKVKSRAYFFLQMRRQSKCFQVMLVVYERGVVLINVEKCQHCGIIDRSDIKFSFSNTILSKQN